MGRDYKKEEVQCKEAFEAFEAFECFFRGCNK
jgi:hypothetical protein